MNFQQLQLIIDRDIGLIELRTADQRNRLTLSLLAELGRALEQVQQDQQTKLLLLTGRGRTFSVGADVAEIDALEAAAVAQFVRAGQTVIKQLLALEIPTLAAVNGLALGGGCELALACDIRWAHSRAIFALPEGKLGLNPAWGGTQLLKRTLSPSWQFELLLGGDYLRAERACSIGLVSRIFEGQDFLLKVTEEARKFTAKERPVLKALKKLARTNFSLEEGLQAEASTFEALWSRRADDR